MAKLIVETAPKGHTVELSYSDRNYNTIKRTFKSKDHANSFVKKDDKDKYGNIRSFKIRNLEYDEMHPDTVKDVKLGAPRL